MPVRLTMTTPTSDFVEVQFNWLPLCQEIGDDGGGPRTRFPQVHNHHKYMYMIYINVYVNLLCSYVCTKCKRYAIRTILHTLRTARALVCLASLTGGSSSGMRECLQCVMCVCLCTARTAAKCSDDDRFSNCCMCICVWATYDRA